MAKYSHDTIVPFKDSSLGKKEQVADMFDRIARRYDLVNSFLSGGVDKYWRKKAIRQLAASAPRNILDVATGTAEMAILMAKQSPGMRVTGVDISAGMLDIGRQKIAGLKLDGQVKLQEGDSEALPFPDNSFDAVTVAFGVRNFANLEKGLAEMLRVLQPGGRLVVLEFSQPQTAGFRMACKLYMRLVASPVGRILSRNRQAYAYLNESVMAFPEGRKFLDILDRIGYTGSGLQALSLGICTVYWGAKIML